MKVINILFFVIVFQNLFSQTINLNESYLENFFRNQQLIGNNSSDLSFTIRPLKLNLFEDNEFENFYKNYLIKSKKTELSVLPLDLRINFNSHHPYNRNNGIMIPSRGYQQLTSFGIHFWGVKIFAKNGRRAIPASSKYHAFC